jgi:hypothetical protein
MVTASPSAERSEFDRQLTVLSIVGDRYALLVARELRYGELTVTGGTHPVEATM